VPTGIPYAEHGAGVNMEDTRLVKVGIGGGTPAHYAARAGQLDSLQVLVDAGADPGKLCSNGVPPLTYATTEATANLIIGAVRASGKSLIPAKHRDHPFMQAASLNNTTLVTHLLNGSGPPGWGPTALALDIDMQDERGQTALHRAAAAGASNVAEVLVSYGAAVDVADKAGRTALAMGRSLNVLRVLLEAGCDPTELHPSKGSGRWRLMD
jgi:ankyrin repeat protein